MSKNLLALLIIFLSILQGPFIYYYGGGFMSFVFILPYLFIGLILSSFLLYSIIAKKGIATKFHITALTFGVCLGTISLFSEDYFEKIDWHFRKGQRKEIISRIKSGSIIYDANKSVHHLNEFKYALISNGGNDISISTNEKNQVTVEFFINRGFLDHYSAFVYTDAPNEIKRLEKEIQSSFKENNFKITKNWYRLNY